MNSPLELAQLEAGWIVASFCTLLLLDASATWYLQLETGNERVAHFNMVMSVDEAATSTNYDNIKILRSTYALAIRSSVSSGRAAS